MPLISVTDNNTLGNLVVREYNPADGYCRDEVTVNSTTARRLAMGTVLAQTADGEDFHVAVAADLVAGTKFGVLIGDHFDVQPFVDVAAGTDTLVLAYVRGPLQLSDWLIRENNTLSDANFTTLFGLLREQGVIVLKAV